MDSNGFDDQIFTDFAGQLTPNQGELLSRDGQPRSPNMHHSIQVMLGMQQHNQQQHDIIHQHHDKITQEMMMSCSGSPVSASKMAAVHHDMGLYADHPDVPPNDVKAKLEENGQTATSTVDSVPKKSEGGSKKKSENNGIKKKKTR